MYVLATMMSYVAGLKDRKEEKGATAVEYGLLVALIAAVIVVTVGLLGTEIKTAFTTVLTEIGGTAPTT